MEWLERLFAANAERLCWLRLDDDRGGILNSTPLSAGQHYYTIRLREMYVRRARVLWRKLYPMVYSYIRQGADEENAVAGPGQLKDLGDTNLDRIVNINHRLAGPTVFRGGEVSMLVGLYTVPGADAARALLDVVGQIASLGGLTLGTAPQIAGVLKGGVENLLGLDGASLQFGVRDSFFSSAAGTGNPLRPGVYVGINAPQHSVDAQRMWVKGGRLLHGDDPISGRPYDNHDYILVEVERRDTREDWPSIPDIAGFEKKFSELLSQRVASVEEHKSMLAAIWPDFDRAVSTSVHLTDPDKNMVKRNVEAELKRRLDVIHNNNPFATRGATGEASPDYGGQPQDFDFLTVPTG